MERFKRAMKYVAMMLSLCFVFALSVTAQAADVKYANGAVYVNPAVANGNYVSVNKMRMATYDTSSIEVVFPKGAEVTNVRTNKKALSAKLSYYDNDYERYYDDNDNFLYGYGKAYVDLASTKAGTYKVSFDVAGTTQTVTVVVTKFGGAAVTKVTVDGKVIAQAKKSGTNKKLTVSETANYKISGSKESAKVKITADTGIKITGLVTAYADKDGVNQYKAVKNGKTVKFSKSYTNVYKGELGSKYRDARKLTKVYVSYSDKKMKTSVKYSVTKKHGVKQIKRVAKLATGVKTVSYFDPLNHSDYDNLSDYYGVDTLTFFAY